MTHYVALVAIPPDGDPKEHVTRVLAPYDENADEWCQGDDCDGDCGVCTRNGWWDWWVIGGRWTGWLDPDYDASKDPANFETCFLCLGSGRRPDADKIEASNPGWTEWSGGCNGCQGTGKSLKHPPAFRPCPSDITTPEAWLALTEDDVPHKTPFTLVTFDGVFHKQRWTGAEWVETPEWQSTVERFISAHAGGARLVTVDYHT